MISKARVKYIKSLQVKKYRKAEQLFLVEGAKSVEELLQSDFEVTWVAGTTQFLELHKDMIDRSNIEIAVANEVELAAIGTFNSNDGAIATARMKINEIPVTLNDEIVLVLDDIRDPGNLGTIIRTADWYGIKNIIASEETADFYNPKTIHATMGSFCRVNVFYTSLSQYLSAGISNVYGAFLSGINVHELNLPVRGCHLVIGNESRGIREELMELIHTKITISRFGKAESLNAAVATSIILDNFRRLQKRIAT